MMKKIKDLTTGDFKKASWGKWRCVLKEGFLFLEIDDNSDGKFRWVMALDNVELRSEYCFLSHPNAIKDLKSRIHDILKTMEECL